MLIIIEGCDATGKSTLAETLGARARADGYDVEMIHCGPPKAHPIVEYQYALNGYRPGTNKVIIADRWHLGADVYGPIKRGDDGLSPAVRWHIEMFLKSRGALLVLAQPRNRGDLLHRMRTRGEDFITEDEAFLVVDKFAAVYKESMLAKTTGSIPFDVDAIYNLAKVHDASCASLSQFSSYVGPRRPKILLLGDKKNRNNPTNTDLLSEGAFVPYGRSSGTFLIEALLAQSPETMKDVGIANANEEEVGVLWDSLFNPFVIALGSAASDTCKRGYVPHRAVAHPAYMRRFLNSLKEDYAKEIL